MKIVCVHYKCSRLTAVYFFSRSLMTCLRFLPSARNDTCTQ